MTTNNAIKNGTIKLDANLIPASTMTNAAKPNKMLKGDFLAIMNCPLANGGKFFVKIKCEFCLMLGFLSSDEVYCFMSICKNTLSPL
ncbi:hypothetical protein [Moraxella lacunata]|uniref:hypothetical protein n=1 Tax=Moraxella lacunata TaxID=477 RepID=UPI003EDEA618